MDYRHYTNHYRIVYIYLHTEPLPHGSDPTTAIWICYILAAEIAVVIS